MRKFFKELIINRKTKKHLKSFSLVPATKNDLLFIFQQLVEGARSGHYSSGEFDMAKINLQMFCFEKLLEGYGIPILSDRGKENRIGCLLMYQNGKNENVGFIYVLERFEGSGFNDIELNMFSIGIDFQKNGYGNHMLFLFITMFNKSDVYAKCLKKSQGMMALLHSFGFKGKKFGTIGSMEFIRKV